MAASAQPAKNMGRAVEANGIFSNSPEQIDLGQSQPQDSSLSPRHHSVSFEDPCKKLAEVASRLLMHCASDPSEYLDNLAAQNQHLVCLRWILNLNVLEHIPLKGSISYSKLASLASVPENQLKSIIRMTASYGFLEESQPLSVEHSGLSASLISNPSFLNRARFLTNYSVPSAFRFTEATQKWGQTEKKNETGFNVAMSTEQPFFDHLKDNPKMNATFSSYMQSVVASPGMSLAHLIKGFDWSSLPSGAKVIDVGGSSGHASAALSQAFPKLQLIVEDLPETIANAETATLKGQLQFLPHDFFSPQPVMDGDVYLLRMIIHDWPDTEAKKILSHIKDALRKPGARIVIMDTILPRPGTTSILQERQLRVRDLTMRQVFNAKEREFEDWEALLQSVGLRIFQIHQPEGSSMGILEIGLAEEAVRNVEQVNAVTGHGSSQKITGLETPVLYRSVPKKRAEMPDAVKTNDFSTPEINGKTHSFATNGLADGHAKAGELPVLIIGAGISGLCLAQNLRKHSIPFLVFERDQNTTSRPQGYRLKLEEDAANALRESLTLDVYEAFEKSCAISALGETDYDPISGACIKSRAGGGLAGSRGLRASHTVDRASFRGILMTGIEDRIHFARELDQFHVKNIENYVEVRFKDGSTTRGRFLVGADGSRSIVRKQHLPSFQLLDTRGVCIYGKTPITPELVQRFPAKAMRWMTACSDTAPLIQSILIGESPLTLLSEPIRFPEASRTVASVSLPDDYIYWVVIGRKELFTEDDSGDEKTHCPTDPSHRSATARSVGRILELTNEWHPSIRALFELQDRQECLTMQVVSAPPKIPPWETSRFVTVIGDAIHAMSPCGGVGANTALRDAAELGALFAAQTLARPEGDFAKELAGVEEGLRKRAFTSIMRSFVGSRKMFDQRPFAELQVAKDALST